METFECTTQRQLPRSSNESMTCPALRTRRRSRMPRRPRRSARTISPCRTPTYKRVRGVGSRRACCKRRIGRGAPAWRPHGKDLCPPKTKPQRCSHILRPVGRLCGRLACGAAFRLKNNPLKPQPLNSKP